MEKNHLHDEFSNNDFDKLKCSEIIADLKIFLLFMNTLTFNLIPHKSHKYLQSHVCSDKFFSFAKTLLQLLQGNTYSFIIDIIFSLLFFLRFKLYFDEKFT